MSIFCLFFSPIFHSFCLFFFNFLDFCFFPFCSWPTLSQVHFQSISGNSWQKVVYTSQYGSHLYRDTSAEVLGSEVVRTPPSHIQERNCSLNIWAGYSWDIRDPDVGISRAKNLCKWPFLIVLAREWPGSPGIWVGTSRIWKNFMQENFGLIFRSLHIMDIVWGAWIYWNPTNSTRLPENQKPPNSETQKVRLRNSENLPQKPRKSTEKLRKSEFPRQSLRVG